MKKKLFIDLMRFASAKRTPAERVRYIFFGVIYYFFLLKTLRGSEKGSRSASASEAGDDIYPLF
jgi:hypothetical protein